MKYILAHETARRRAIAAVTDAAPGMVVTIKAQTRTSEQNAALHARLGEIADRISWAGKKWDIETWKRLLVAAWSRASGESTMILPAIDGAGVDIVFRRTSTMTKGELSSLLDFVNAWCAEQPEMNNETT
ncbi:MAG: recombination protein NinB [Caldilineaceae bacterium]